MGFVRLAFLNYFQKKKDTPSDNTVAAYKCHSIYCFVDNIIWVHNCMTNCVYLFISKRNFRHQYSIQVIATMFPNRH